MLAPLVAYVGSKGSPGERVEHTFAPLVYLPVSKQSIDSVRVWIRDEKFEHVAVLDDGANVVLCLLFRKASVWLVLYRPARFCVVCGMRLGLVAAYSRNCV